jgi:hypothetical protein
MHLGLLVAVRLERWWLRMRLGGRIEVWSFLLDADYFGVLWKACWTLAEQSLEALLQEP